jgi:hypothetical protein
MEIKKWFTPIIYRVQLARRWRVLSLSLGKGHPIVRALYETVINKKSTVEKQFIASIESCREQLLDNHQYIEFLDFGKGSPESARSTADMHKGVYSKERISVLAKASKPCLWGILLHKIVLYTGAKRCLEMGTCVGISSSYIGSALSPQGMLITLEGAQTVAAVAQSTLHSLGLDGKVKIIVGPFHHTLEIELKKLRPLDFVFVDGHHDQEATEHYFAMLLPYMKNGGMIVFDDIRWSNGMRQAWKTICRQHKGACIDLNAIGIVLLQ